MKAKALREKNQPGELERLLQESRNRLRELRFLLASGKVKNFREIREHRKIVARALTLLREHNE